MKDVARRSRTKRWGIEQLTAKGAKNAKIGLERVYFPYEKAHALAVIANFVNIGRQPR